MQKLSVVISAYNEEDVIESCFMSVSWADEIVLIDNSSTDKTAAIAKKFKANVYRRPNNPMLNVNKNYGFTKATGDWILNLDADESIDEQLRQEIQQILSSDQAEYSGYQMPRKNTLFGKWIRHAGWYPDYQMRLFQKGAGTFAEKHVHEHVRVSGKTGTLSGHILHNSFRTVSQFIRKHDLYSTNEAENLIEEGYQFNPLDSIRLPRREFISRYFAREGYKDGLHGLVLSLLMSFYHLLIFLKLWERQKYAEKSLDVPDVEKELNAAHDEMGHWFLEVSEHTSLMKIIRAKLKRLL
ncbi:MAG: glycosyltransferase family 2 protein [Candidatus Roizmanbacteria bacterium]|nr:glycosyltransferase family 2 protein [Candidatus Roizmanbacteria bacterium]